MHMTTVKNTSFKVLFVSSPEALVTKRKRRREGIEKDTMLIHFAGYGDNRAPKRLTESARLHNAVLIMAERKKKQRHDAN